VTEVRLANEFSPYLGGRYRDDGPWSGQQFREDYLVPWLNAAHERHEPLVLILDGVAGVPSSFLEEAFGGLLRNTRWTIQQLRSTLTLTATDPDLWPYVKLADRFMAEAASRH
jgi:hypothetical protein